MVDIEDLKSKFLNLEYDTKTFELDPQRAIAIAKASGEILPQFTDPEHAEFEAVPAMVASLASGRRLPIDFPSLGGIAMDGGKAVTSLKAIRPGTPLTGRTHLHDIYDKSGRSGRMIFLVARMEIFNEGGEHVATSDSRMVIREKPDA
ncbi:MAG: MaoC family dehydratase N-terminal domain-containing protein [Proteobacteria bacterium]|nr:MaoC family dehydratase N-terminal domain-containing protein [Pseudomonadota bacterium]